MSKKVLVVLADGFEEIEAIAPIDILRRAGLEVVVAGVGKTVIESARGVKVTAESRVEDFKGLPDALILPGGGGGAQNLAKSAAVSELIKKMVADKRPVGAICASPVLVLAPLGVLDGRRATCYTGMEDGFGPKVTFSKERVVTDGAITTSRGPGTAIEFSFEMVRRIAGEKAVAELREAMLVV